MDGMSSMNAGSRVAVKLLPSLADIAFLMPMALLFGRMGGLVALLGDGDTGWHIRTGEWILAHHAVPYRDLFSYSKPDSIWYAWEWLADVILASLNKVGGLAAVSLFAILMIAVTFTLVFRLARRKSNAVVAILVTVLAMAGASIHWLARPHLFTLFFVVIFLNALYRVKEGHTRVAGIPWLALLPVLTVLWTNLHGGFLVGVTFGVLRTGNRPGRSASPSRPGGRLPRTRPCRGSQGRWPLPTALQFADDDDLVQALLVPDAGEIPSSPVRWMVWQNPLQIGSQGQISGVISR